MKLWKSIGRLLLPLSLSVLLCLSFVANCFAVTLDTSSLAASVQMSQGNSYSWTSNLVYNQTVTFLRGVNSFRFTTPSFTPTGGVVSLHYETNIVAVSGTNGIKTYEFVNLPFLNLTGCSFNGVYKNVTSWSVSTALTDWTGNDSIAGWERPRTTLTVYVDAVFTGVTPNQSTTMVCTAGNANYDFLINTMDYGSKLYFEKNVVNSEYFDDNSVSDALLQTQINQNNTIINQNNEIIAGQNQLNTDLNNNFTDLNNNITDSDTSEQTDTLGAFFNNFDSDDFGLTSIITAPLNAIKSINLDSCQELVLDLPFVDDTLVLPCMTPIYQQHLGVFFTIYQTVIYGLLCYHILLNLYRMIHKMKDPDNDEIEVFDL